MAATSARTSSPPSGIHGASRAGAVIVNIVSFHALMAPSGLPLAIFVAVLWAVIVVDVRPAFAGLFQARLQARA